MSTEAENLLLQTLSEEPSGPVTLIVNEKTRTIEYDGELLLGVEDDDNAERIYFVMPKMVGNDDLIDTSSTDVEIFIIYKNAINNIYKQQCTDVTVDGDNVKFSWLLTRYAAAAAGKVSFMVCVQKLGTNTESKPIILNEWHTTPCKGTVLVGIDTDHTTSEVLPANSIASTAQLRKEVDALSVKIDEHIIGYSKSEIDDMILDAFNYTDALERILVDTTNPLKVTSSKNAEVADSVNISYSTSSTKCPLLFHTKGLQNNPVSKAEISHNSDVYIDPSKGDLYADGIIYENNVKLSDKYAAKNEQSLVITLNTPVEATVKDYITYYGDADAYIDNNESTAKLHYIKYPFTYDASYLEILRKAKYIDINHGNSIYRLSVASIRYYSAWNDDGLAQRVQVNATYTDNVPGGTCLNRTYYFAINMQYTTGSTANFTIYRESDSQMTWKDITQIAVKY